MGHEICYLCDSVAVGKSKSSRVPVCKFHKNLLESEEDGSEEFEKNEITEPRILLPDGWGIKR
jgi:hypothetical protein